MLFIAAVPIKWQKTVTLWHILPTHLHNLLHMIMDWNLNNSQFYVFNEINNIRMFH